MRKYLLVMSRHYDGSTDERELEMNEITLALFPYEAFGRNFRVFYIA